MNRSEAADVNCADCIQCICKQRFFQTVVILLNKSQYGIKTILNTIIYTQSLLIYNEYGTNIQLSLITNIPSEQKN